jgi:phosphoesterase RecJ-like protein
LNTDQLKQLGELLKSPKRIIITTHRSPDGDAVGSSLALYHYLLKKGHDVNVITPDDYPEFLHWLPGNDKVICFARERKRAAELTSNAELIFCLDFNALNRLWEFRPFVEKVNVPVVMIDHHQEPEQFATFTFLDVTASSTAQLIYEFIEGLNDLALLDRTIGDCLYTGIVTDTGSFKFPSTSQKTHQVAAEIKRLGSDTTAIHNLIYDNSSEDRLRLLGYALSAKLQVFKTYNTAIISLSKEELDRFNYRTGDTEGIVNYALSIKGIVLAVLITEKKGEARLSLRSKGDFSVNEMARTYFSGGGHRNAAGGIHALPVEAVVDKIKSILPEYKGKLFN